MPVPSTSNYNYHPFIPASQKHLMVQMREMGLDVSLIAELTSRHISTVYRVIKLYRDTGNVVTRDRPTGRPRKLDSFDVMFLEDCVERTPDLQLDELVELLEAVCGVRAAESTIRIALRTRGLTYKKMSKVALERDENARVEYSVRMALTYEAHQLVFVDESGINRFTTERSHGWAPVGDRAWRRDFFVRGVKYSILPALSLDGVLHLAVMRGGHNGVTFTNFIHSLLDKMNPYPGPNSVLVMDNASIHHMEDIRPLVEARGMRLEYLPPYSPDKNPIEEAFSSIKHWIRRHRDTIRPQLESDDTLQALSALYDAVDSVTAAKARGWFSHAGYL